MDFMGEQLDLMLACIIRMNFLSDTMTRRFREDTGGGVVKLINANI